MNHHYSIILKALAVKLKNYICKGYKNTIAVYESF